MNWASILLNLQRIFVNFINVLNQTYLMISNNSLLLVFVLMCGIFVGLALLKRLIHIN